jgi:hypothetical protein
VERLPDRWDGRQAHEYALSTKYRAVENRFATKSGQQALAQKFKVHAVRASLLGVSAVLLTIAVYFVAPYPTA